MSREQVADAFIRQAQAHLTCDFLPKIRRCLEVLSEEEIWWRSHSNTNSVGNLVLHLCGNVRQWIVAGQDSLSAQPANRRTASRVAS